MKSIPQVVAVTLILVMTAFLTPVLVPSYAQAPGSPRCTAPNYLIYVTFDIFGGN